MSSWWYLSGDDKKGPFDEKFFPEIIKQESLNANTQVWTKGFASWTPLADVHQFMEELTENEFPPEVPANVKKRSTSIETILNTKETDIKKLGKIALFAVAALAIAFHLGTKSGTSDLATQAFNASSGKPLVWTNLETLKSVGVSSSYNVEAMLQNDIHATTITDTFSKAYMIISSEITSDGLEKYVDDLIKTYKQRGRKISQAQFIELHGAKAWEAIGFTDSEDKEAYKVIIHKENGKVWITGAIHPTWLPLKDDRADFYNRLLETTFM